MRKAIIFLIVSIFIVSMITGCSKSPVSPAETQGSADEQLVLNCFHEKELYAGQHELIGRVLLDYTEKYGYPCLVVEFRIDDDNDWYLTETHLYVGENAPVKNAPGQFPYKHEGDDIAPFAKYDLYKIKIPDYTVWPEFYFSAHAVVTNAYGDEETAWGENTYEFEHGWGWYCLIPHPGTPPPSS